MLYSYIIVIQAFWVMEEGTQLKFIKLIIASTLKEDRLRISNVHDKFE